MQNKEYFIFYDYTDYKLKYSNCIHEVYTHLSRTNNLNFKKIYDTSLNKIINTEINNIQYLHCQHIRDNFRELTTLGTQSGLPLEVAQNENTTTVETVTFLDENLGTEQGLAHREDELMDIDYTPKVELAEFLSRPVRIATISWTEAQAIKGSYTSMRPWHLFFDDTRIKNKLANYAFLRCDLKLKFLINASPFYYGAMLVSYQPLNSITPSTIKNTAQFHEFIPYSQRPHTWIYPQSNEGSEMTLPFFYNRNWLRIQEKDDFDNMGVIEMMNVTTLQSANGAVGAGVTIQVYAWAENVKLAGPSVGLPMQAGDEYGVGVVSKPASVISHIASRLTDIPFIGKFATATQIGASAISTIASMFGFTNVPVLSDVQPYRPNMLPNLATTDVGYPLDKLTLDSKNELAIDPSIVGLETKDELSIAHISQKDSYLTTATWSTTNNVDDILFSSRVTPFQFTNNGAAQAIINMVPMALVSQMFASWRGDIIFGFKFIATPYHKGRVRISYDPAGVGGNNIITDATSSSVVYTQIIDLGKDSYIELRVPFTQALPWLRTYTANGSGNVPFSTSTTPPFIYDDTRDNGTIVMRVLTNLTAPVVTSNVPIIVSVRGAENLEFANPQDCVTNLSHFPVQSGNQEANVTTVVAGSSSPIQGPEYLLNFGEAVKSLRQVLRRSALSYVHFETLSNSNGIAIIKHRMSKYPPYFGYDPFGIHSAKGLINTTTNFPFNYTKNSPYNIIAPCFVAQRGSMIWHFNTQNLLEVGSIRVIRTPETAANAQLTTYTTGKGSISANANTYLQNTQAGSGAQSVTNQKTQSGMSVLLPNYTNFKFLTTSPNEATQAITTYGAAYDFYNLELDFNNETGPYANNTKIWKYASIGTDYNLLFFLNVPSLYALSAYPVPN